MLNLWKHLLKLLSGQYTLCVDKSDKIPLLDHGHKPVRRAPPPKLHDRLEHWENPYTYGPHIDTFDQITNRNEFHREMMEQLHKKPHQWHHSIF